MTATAEAAKELRVTLKQILSWEPCSGYTPSRIRELAAGRKDISALECLDLPIPAADKLWLVLRVELITENVLRELACDFAEWVLPNYESRYPKDGRVRQCIEVARRWIRGEATNEERSAALSAALSAARSADDSAACSAADSAACSAADSAADSAARSAARSAAYSAARSAAYSAALSAADSAACSAAYSAADSAALSAARSAARSAAYSAARSAEMESQIELVRKRLTENRDKGVAVREVETR